MSLNISDEKYGTLKEIKKTDIHIDKDTQMQQYFKHHTQEEAKNL